MIYNVATYTGRSRNLSADLKGLTVGWKIQPSPGKPREGKMELNTVVQFVVANWHWGVYALLYLGSWFVLRKITNYFFGDNVEGIVMAITGIPLVVPLLITAVVTWPWRYRRQRLFRETFSINPRGMEWDEIFTQTQLVLRQLARDFHGASQYEIALLKAKGVTPLDRVEASRDVRKARDNFWSAYDLAKSQGYVWEEKGKKPSFTDFL